MANEGTVGILKAILTADTTSFDAGMKKAAAAPKAVEKAVTGLSEEVKKLAPQAERMVKSFGGDKLLYQANNLTAAVQKLGGAQKLTEAEQARVNRTLTEAIAKYKLLGIEAPEAMVKVANATKQITPPTSLASHATDQLKTSFSSLLGAFALSNIITNGVTSLIGIGKEAVASGARLVDLRDKTGLTLATLQRMDFVATQSGDSLESLTDAAFKLSRALAGGTSSVRGAVHDLGLDFARLQRMTPDEQFEAIAAALSKVQNAGERSRIGFELFGKSFISISGSIKAGYKQVADQAVLASDAQLEALDRAGDAWEAFKNRQVTYVRAILGATVSAIEELRKMRFSEIAKMALAAASGPNAAGDLLAMLSERAGKEGQGKGFIGPPQRVVPPVPANYVTMLKEAQKAVDSLTASQRDQLAAAQKMNASEEDQLALLDRFGIKVDDAKGVLKLFSETTKAASGSLSGEFHKALTKLNEDLGRAKNLSDIDFAKEFGPKLEDMNREMVKFGVTGAKVPKNIGDGFTRLLNIELAKFSAEMAAIPDRLEAIGREAAALLNDVEASAGQSAVRRTANERESAKISRSTEFSRATAAIESAKRWGASWQQVYAMESDLSRRRMIAEVADSQTAFDERVRALRLTTDISQAEYDSMREIEKKTQEQIVEDWRLAEQAKRDELKLTHDVWIRTLASLRDMGLQIQSDFSHGLADMLTGLRGFKEGWIGIWQSIRQSFSNLLGQMLNDFIGGFLRKMVGAASGMGSMFGGGGVGGGGGLIGSAGSVATGFLPKLLGFGGGGAAAATDAGSWALGAGTLTLGGEAAGTGAAGAAGGAAATSGTAAAGGGGAAGFLTNPAFWTNPWTIAGIGTAALLWWGIKKKGWFRGGEEGVQVNPARDKFLSQFGKPENKGTGGAGWNLAALLTKDGAGDGGGSLFSSLQNARKMKAFQAAEENIITFLAAHGKKGLKKFHTGGIVGEDGTLTDTSLSNGEVLIKALRGEAVLNKRGTAAVGGRPVIDSLNAGHGAGSALLGMFGGKKADFKTFATDLMAKMAAHGAKAAKAHVGGFGFFANGGFVAPNVEMPAMLHGGSMGEMVVPLAKLAEMGGSTHEVHNHYYTIQGWDGADIDRVFRQEIIPRQKRALQLNQEDLRGHTKRVLK